MRERVKGRNRKFAQQLRSRSTEAEQALWFVLRSRRMQNAKFRRQVPIANWIVDFVSFDHHLIVEVDGGQHNESNQDKQRDAALAARGFRILRFWNSDVLARPQSVLERIMEATKQSPSPGFAPDGAQPPSPTRGEGKESYPE